MHASRAVLVIVAAAQLGACSSPEPSSKPPVASQSPAQQSPTRGIRYLADDLPLLPAGLATAQFPVEVIRASYEFAARHPEVLNYIPCFCGCQQAGHRGNHECFVRSRAANGDIIEWDEHGVECTVCIDVATRARQMHASGASVADIRAAVDREFGPLSPTSTPTPKPPAADHSH